jgi:hypothetical protein
MEQVTVGDAITAARLEWLDAEADLAELLPSGSPLSADSVPHGGPNSEDLAEAIQRSERAHAAYIKAVRRCAGLASS